MATLTIPKLDEISKKIKYHNHTRTDNFYWIRKKKRKAISHMKKENNYTVSKMKSTKNIQNLLYKEFLSRTKENHKSIPYLYKGWLYFTTITKGENYKRYYRRRENTNTDILILDCVELAKKHKYWEIGDYDISPNGVNLAYTVDTTGSEDYKLYVIDLDTNKSILEINIDICNTICWSYDNKNIYYPTEDDTGRPSKVWKHSLRTSVKDDILLYEEKDVKYDISLTVSDDEKYIFINTGSSTTDEVYIINDSDITLVSKRKKNIEYGLNHHDNKFYILTNKDDSKNFKIMVTDVCNTDKKTWKDFISYDELSLIHI